MDPRSFAPRLIAWQRTHGRHDLPWQRTHDPYRIWLSEVMLQQTQVATVIPYFARFLTRCPDVAALAAASHDDVMALWAGLGYYSRARNLHRCAKEVMERFGGVFPLRATDLETLPGIGRSTAAAIAAFAYGAHEAILDGNVKRVLARVFGISGFPGEKRVETAMWDLANALLPLPALAPGPSPGPARARQASAATLAEIAHDDAMRAYTQGLMDLGATLCTRSKPDCGRCPFQDDCIARRDARQAELPTRRPARVTPTRTTVMLVIEAEHYLLLYRRPPSGIWGGLWSLPEAAGEEEARAIARDFGASAEAVSRLTPFSHTFTHFKLDITPLHVAVIEPQGAPPSASPVAFEWVRWQELDRYGVPAPVRRLLDSLRGSLL